MAEIDYKQEAIRLAKLDIARQHRDCDGCCPGSYNGSLESWARECDQACYECRDEYFKSLYKQKYGYLETGIPKED